MELFSKLIEKPKMQEKLLRKPSPRYVYDILMATMAVTGFPKGLYSDDEINPKFFDESPQNKYEIFQKTIEITKIVLNEKFELKTTNILKGEEPEKTNYFLQAFYKAATSGKDFSKFIGKYLEHKQKKKDETQKQEAPKETQSQDKIIRKPTVVQEKSQDKVQENQQPAKFEKQTTLATNTAANQVDQKQTKTQSNTGAATNKIQNDKPKLPRPDSAMKRPDKINSEIKEIKDDANKNSLKAPQGLIKDNKKAEDQEEKMNDNKETKLKIKNDDISLNSNSGTIKIERINTFDDKLFGESDKKSKVVLNAADLNAIKNYVQDITKNANPIGKIIDFLGDDIESMNKELQSWIRESKTYKDRHDEEVKYIYFIIMNRKSDEELLSLQNELLELEETIRDENIRIKSIKTRLIKSENIIQSLINNVISIKNDNK